MKSILCPIAMLFITLNLYAQAPEVSRDEEGNKVLKGFITKQELATDTAFSWFAKNQQGYVPDPEALNSMKANRDSLNFLTFGGTWCHDSQYILPKFFVLADAAGLSPDRITLVGVDHEKRSIQHLSEAFNITNIPTIIVLKNGKEIGRVIEYGKSGLFDKELGKILRK
jgi:thiol-disulfide isomerase/thioredoxin